MAKRRPKKPMLKFPKRMRKKMIVMFTVVAALMIGLIGRLMYIEYTSGEKYEKIVLAQQGYDSQTIPYQRGDIVDAKGTVLATSIAVYNVILDCSVLNDDEKYEINSNDIPEDKCQFVWKFPEDFEKDFFAIMEEAVCEYVGYRFWVITYEVEKFVMKSLSAILMDKDFDRVQEISILEALKPNFAELTSVEPNQEKKKDVRSLLSIKKDVPVSKSTEPEKRTEILPKSVEESKEA